MLSYVSIKRRHGGEGGGDGTAKVRWSAVRCGELHQGPNILNNEGVGPRLTEP